MSLIMRLQLLEAAWKENVTNTLVVGRYTQEGTQKPMLVGNLKPRKDEVQKERLQLRDDDVWVLPREFAEHVQHPVITIQNYPTLFISAYDRRDGLALRDFERDFVSSHIGARRPDVRFLWTTIQGIDDSRSSSNRKTAARTAPAPSTSGSTQQSSSNTEPDGQEPPLPLTHNTRLARLQVLWKKHLSNTQHAVRYSNVQTNKQPQQVVYNGKQLSLVESAMPIDQLSLDKRTGVWTWETEDDDGRSLTHKIFTLENGCELFLQIWDSRGHHSNSMVEKGIERDYVGAVPKDVKFLMKKIRIIDSEDESKEIPKPGGKSITNPPSKSGKVEPVARNTTPAKPEAQNLPEPLTRASNLSDAYPGGRSEFKQSKLIAAQILTLSEGGLKYLFEHHLGLDPLMVNSIKDHIMTKNGTARSHQTSHPRSKEAVDLTQDETTKSNKLQQGSLKRSNTTANGSKDLTGQSPPKRAAPATVYKEYADMSDEEKKKYKEKLQAREARDEAYARALNNNVVDHWSCKDR